MFASDVRVSLDSCATSAILESLVALGFEQKLPGSAVHLMLAGGYSETESEDNGAYN